MNPVPLNKLCEIEDFRHPALVAAIRALETEHVAADPGYPRGKEHRKSWEYAQLMCGVERLGAVGPDSLVLAVAAGTERPVFAFTNRCRMVFATDIYGMGDFAAREAQSTMLVDPDRFAPFPYNRRRLVVQHMNALDLRYEDNTFDLVFSLSSIEHFGGLQGARQGLSEMARVCKPDGVVMLTTECIVNGKPDYEVNNLQLFSPLTLEALVRASLLQLVEPIQFRLGAETRRHVRNLEQVVSDLAHHNRTEMPHLVLEMHGYEFTSISLFLRKAAS